MRKRTKTKVFALGMALSMAMSMIMPSRAFAEGETNTTPYDTDTVQFYYAQNKKGDYYRTGVKKIVLDPYTYSDITGGKHVALTHAQLEDIVQNNLLPKWGKVADDIFATQGIASAYDGDIRSADKHSYNAFSDSANSYHKDYGTFNVRDTLISTGKYTGSEWGKSPDYMCTGLQTTGTLEAVREKMADTVVKGVNSSGGFNVTGVLEESPLGTRLKYLKDNNESDGHGGIKNRKTPVVFKIATRVNRSSKSQQSYYSSFGIAFFDFDLAVIADDEIGVITDAEEFLDEENPLKAASDAGKVGVSYKESGISANGNGTTSSYTENNSTQETEVSMTFQNTNTLSVETRFDETEEYSYSETIGNEFHFGPEDGPFSDVLTVEFNANQVFSTARGQSNSAQTDQSQELTNTLPIPAQSAIQIVQQQRDTDVVIKYDQPVALTYKVAIFSIGGHVMTDGTDDGYYQNLREQTDFYTVYEGNSETAGYSANENLYIRGVLKADDTSFDHAYGSTAVHFYKDSSSLDYDDNCIHYDYMSSSQKNELKNVALDVPMASEGTTMKIAQKLLVSQVNDIVPLYLLKNVNLAEGIEDEYDMTIGDTFPLSSLTLEGTNKNKVPYYGFDSDDGKWVLCDKDGNIMDDDSEAIVTLSESKTGKQSVKAIANGTQYLKWILNDDVVKEKKYTALKESGYADNKSINTVILQLNISDKPFDGKLVLSGTYEGIVDQPAVKLSEAGLSAFMEDGSGKEVDRPFLWEAKELKGIQVEEDGSVTFSKPGTYHVRVFIENTAGKICSEWVEIKAKLHDLEKVERVEPTTEKEGVIEHWKCKVCDKLYADAEGKKELKLEDVIIPAIPPTPTPTPTPTPSPEPKWDKGTVKEPSASSETVITYVNENNPEETKTEVVPVLLAELKSTGKNSLTMKWSKEPLADGYDIFFAKCNNNESKSVCKLVKTIKNNNTIKWSKSKLKKGTCYKGYVKAYRMVDGKKEYIATSYTAHSITGNSNKSYTNVKSLSLKKKKLSLSKGASATVSVKIKKAKAGKKLIAHSDKIRYATSDSKIATVSRKGTITAVSEGKCKIYVIGVNGVRTTVNVTVK